MRNANQLAGPQMPTEVPTEVQLIQLYAEISNPQLPAVMLLGIGAVALEKSIETAADN